MAVRLNIDKDLPLSTKASIWGDLLARKVLGGRLSHPIRHLLAAPRGGGSPAIPAFWYPAENFGDSLTPSLLWHLTGKPPLLSTAPGPKFFGVGSVLDRVREGDVIWGSGSIRPGRLTPGGSVVVTALRGPRSAESLGISPDELVLGDPAQLLPLIHSPSKREVRFADNPRCTDMAFLPHYTDETAAREFSGLPIISPLGNWRLIVDLVTSYNLILSSSLHGIIVAEAYRIPVVWVASLKREIIGGEHKFQDYFEGSGRFGLRPVDLRSAVSEPNPLPQGIFDNSGLLRELGTATERFS